MSKAPQPVIRLSELALRSEETGSAYACRTAGIDGPLGLKRLTARYSEVPPGKTFCPFHAHRYVDEMFIILEGEGEYRFGTERHPVKAGDVLGAPMGGAEVAHQLWNTGSEPLKYVGLSSTAEVDVCHYPDSGKFAVFNEDPTMSEDRQFHFIGREEQRLDYFDGDEGAK